MGTTSSRARKLLRIPKGGGWHYVLIGGDAYENQGILPRSRRELMHTSLSYIADAYNNLRQAGVPRANIITIVQLEDFLLSPHLRAGQYPRTFYEKKCARLRSEGGADYDGKLVNPGTVWAVLTGTRVAHGRKFHKVVPHNNDGLMVAIYSHGDSHPAISCAKTPKPSTPALKPDLQRMVNKGKISLATARAMNERARCMDPVSAPRQLNPQQHEWFCHLPYPTTPPALATELLLPVSTEQAKTEGPFRNKPTCYLYATQLKIILARLFANDPSRPVVFLLNFCRGGGALQFMRQREVRANLGIDKWPLLMVSSCQAAHDSLVGGLWDAWFTHWVEALYRVTPDDTPRVNKEAKELLGSWTWEYLDSTGWRPFSAEISLQIERSMKVGASEARYTFRDQQYRLVFKTMTQINMETRKDRKVRRVERKEPKSPTLQDLYDSVIKAYSMDNVYELKGHTVSLVYASNYGQDNDTFPADLEALLASGKGGAPDWDGLRRMQKSYRDGSAKNGEKVLLWHPQNWKGKEVDLVEAVKEARTKVAIPEMVVGDSAMMDTTLAEFMNGPKSYPSALKSKPVSPPEDSKPKSRTPIAGKARACRSCTLVEDLISS